MKKQVALSIYKINNKQLFEIENIEIFLNFKRTLTEKKNNIHTHCTVYSSNNEEEKKEKNEKLYLKKFKY